MTSIATIAANAAQWLAAHDHPDLAPIAALRLEEGSSDHPEIGIQLCCDRDASEALAPWSEELNTPVTVRSLDSFVEGRIKTHTTAGYSVDVWTHFRTVELMDLQSAAGTRFTTTPVELNAAILRAAAFPRATVGGVS